MFLLLRLFNSILFVVANLSIALYTLQRFFRAMKLHYQLVDDVEGFSNVVDQSRASLQYVSEKVTEAMKEMESDIEREVYITHNLTKLAPKIASASKRFAELEEGIIELARLEHNMENATAETPSDINEEVLRVMRALKPRGRIALATSEPSAGGDPQQPRSIPRTAKRRRPASPAAKLALQRAATKPSELAVPEVSLLAEQRHAGPAKPIGFRPPWMCQV